MDDNSRAEINKNANEYLVGYISKVSPHFDNFFNSQKDFSKRIAPVALDMVERFDAFLGGKRLRGSLTKLGYDLFGGVECDDIYKASMVSEVIHGFGLIHDDIMDEDELRRSRPTMHIQYQNVHKEKFPHSKRSQKLYGTSMAINVGDLGPFYANLIINDTKFDPELKIRFLRRVSEVVIQTVQGQGLDVSYEQDETPSEEKVMAIHKFKTAFYTIPGPMQYGAILAGADESSTQYKAIEEYGLPLGIAFQLRDDELGMFSNQKELGKPIYSDLRQGKNTVLFAKAFENANPEQLKFLRSVHGNQDVKESDLKRVNEILIETGALEYSQKLSWKLVEEGKKHIAKITSDPKQRELLATLADYVVTREK